MKKLFLMMLASTMFFACSKDNQDDPSQGKNDFDLAYLSINLTGSKSANTRATDPGTQTGEDDVNDVHILYFDENNLFVGISGELHLNDFTKTGASYKTTNVIEVPAGTQKVFVLVNNYKADGTVRFALPDKTNIGTPWSTLNKTLLYSGDDVNAFISDYTGTKDGKSNFAMGNFGARMDGSAYNTADNGLIKVETGKDAAEAQGKNNSISIDRISSKVQFKIKEINTAGDGEILAYPGTAKFFFQGWELNAVNRSIRLYAEHESGYTGADANGASVAYRQDNNYTLASYGTTPSSWGEYKNLFVYLTNVATDGTGATSAVTRAAGIAYCPENTMQANAQVVGATTKAIVKGNYVPETFAKGESYFTYAGTYYKFIDFKRAYLAAYRGGQTGGIVADMNLFMVAAGLVDALDDPATISDKVGQLDESTLDANTGIRAREANAVRYFHEGVSYYDVLIRHDSRITATMALGKYGAVRNNWYALELNSISRPGTPWIPGGPDDPTTPPNTPDDNVAQLDVTINVHPWTTWNQLVDL